MTQKLDPFVHLHVHTDHSVLDGYGTAAETVKAATVIGQPAIAFTDHGSTTGLYKGYQAAKAEGIKFIAGIEAYFTPSNTTHTEKTPVFFGEGGREDVAGKGAYTHLTILAYNNTGLSNLFRLNYLASTEGFFRKPRMSLEMLQTHTEGLIVTTGCPSGEVQTRLRLGQFDQALGFAAKLVDMLGKENVYVELMDHGMKSDLERGVRTGLMEIAKILDLKLVATNDSHYAHKHDAKTHEEMLAIQTGAYMSEAPDHAGGKRFAFEGHEYYIKTAAQMLSLFPNEDYPGAVSNTLEIAERAQIAIEPRNDLRPHFPLPDGYTSDSQYLTGLAYAGLKERLPGKADDLVYKQRLETELSVIIPKDYANYFLVVADFIKWAKNQGIPVGPARGSAGGSLLAFCLHITDVEPVKHDLLFERFLNPERDSPPDIDVDFDDRYREKVYAYTVEKYGYEFVSQVVTFGGMKGKNSLKDEARIYEFPFDLSNALTKAYPPDVFGKSMSLNDVYDPESKRYSEAESFRSTVKELGAEQIVESALKLEGRMRSTGVHACAVLISGKPLTTAVPLEMRQSDGVMVAQWEYPSCEALGLLKMDFLGLRNLGIVSDAVALIEKHRGVKVDLDALKQGAMDDPATFKLLAEGNTLGVFQLDGGPMRDLLKMMRPTKFDDISAVLALYRPGPMGVNAHTDYALRKNGLQEVDWIHPEFEEPLHDILAPTFGLCVTGDTLVWDADRNVQVRVDEIKSQVEGVRFFTYSLNETTGLVEKKRVSHWFETGVKPVLELALNDGTILRVSEDHPVRTVEGYIKASELVVGSHVALPGRSFGEVSENVSVDEALLLGYLIGDGYLTLKQNSFTNSDMKVIDRVKELAKALFSDVYVRVIPRERNGKHYTNHLYFFAGDREGVKKKGSYSSFQMNDWLCRFLGADEPVLSRDKKVPVQLFGASREAKLAFLAGLWETDGHVGEKSTYLRTISSELASSVQTLLRTLGIHAQIVSNKPYLSAKYGETVSYGVYVYDGTFWTEVLPYMSSQKKHIRFASKTTGTHSFSERLSWTQFKQDMTPVIATKWEHTEPHVAKRITRYQAGAKSIGNFLLTTYGVTGVLNAPTSIDDSIVQSKFSDLYLEHHATTTNKVNAMLSWAKVKEIRNVGPEMMYDITVEDNHNFLANNVIVHNCVYQEQVMQIAQKVSSYSLAQADNLRRAMGKKKREVLDAEYVPFRDGAKANGFSDEAIETLWGVLVPFADYSFNKCFSDRTLVRMGDGSVVSGRELLGRFRAGEELWVQSMWADGEVRPHKVKRVVATGVKPAFRVKTADGRTIITSEDHRLMTTRGYVQVKDMVSGVDELIVADKLPITEKQRESSVKNIRKAHGLPVTDAQVDARVRNMTKLSQSSERKLWDQAASVRMKEYQAGLSFEERSAHQKHVDSVTDRGSRVAQLMRDAKSLKYKNDPVFRQSVIDHLARIRYVSEGQGYGRKSFASNGMWCESQNERDMAEWLIELGVDFEMHKPVGGGQCDFYFEGLYWEMDGMDRHVSYFERKYGDVPFVVVTPEDFRERVSEVLGLEHVRNGDMIVSIEPVSRKTSMVDIEMESDGPKNFVTFKGVVSHNSHTVGYGYMSYLTAYLKANYPAEFFAALLSSVADSTEKTALYLDDARRNGVKVAAPDVNLSGRDYVPLGEDGVLFGLKAVKGVSDAVSDLVVEERERGGRFKDFSDLMNRLPRTIVNKRVFEALAYGGAFDGLGVSRQAVVTALPGLLESFQKAGRVAKKQEAMGGVSLFDGFDFEEELKPEYKVPAVEEFPNMVKLKHERDYLGLYVSGHPLDGLNLDGVGAGMVRVGEVLSENVVVVPDGEYPQRGKEPIITLAGLVSSWAVRLTKKGKQFGAGVLEDRSGSIEFVLFSDAFKDYGNYLKTDGLFALTGYPQHRGGGFSFVVSSLRPLEFSASGNLPVRVRVTEDQWDTGYHDFMLVLQNYAAPAGSKNGTELIVSVRRFDGSVYEETIPFQVLGSPALAQACRGVFGMKCIGRWRDSTL